MHIDLFNKVTQYAYIQNIITKNLLTNIFTQPLGRVPNPRASLTRI